jgi:hypothetical protein
MDWTVIVAAAVGGGLIKAIFDYVTTGRVDRVAKIQTVYEKTLDDMTDRHDKENLEREKKIATLQGELKIRDALLEQARQTQGEMMVTIEDMKTKLDKVGDDVTKITGDFGKFPLAGDPVPYGRRATDKPTTGDS